VGRQNRRRENWRKFNPRYLSAIGDSVLAAELVATRRLVRLLDPDHPHRHRRLLLRRASWHRWEAIVPGSSGLSSWADPGSGATDMEGDLPRRQALLAGQSAGAQASHKPGPLRRLADAPVSPELAARAALDAAGAAAQSGIRIEAFGLGLESAGDHDVYAQIASLSGGHYRALAQPAAVIHELPKIDLADVGSIDLANTTTGAAGRAVRSRPTAPSTASCCSPRARTGSGHARDDAGASRSDGGRSSPTCAAPAWHKRPKLDSRFDRRTRVAPPSRPSWWPRSRPREGSAVRSGPRRGEMTGSLEDADSLPDRSRESLDPTSCTGPVNGRGLAALRDLEAERQLRPPTYAPI
jgi:hypothetical protein